MHAMLSFAFLGIHCYLFIDLDTLINTQSFHLKGSSLIREDLSACGFVLPSFNPFALF